jgi:hypothetical protein
MSQRQSGQFICLKLRTYKFQLTGIIKPHAAECSFVVIHKKFYTKTEQLYISFTHENVI